MLITFTVASLIVCLAVVISKALEDAELARRIKRGDHGAFKHFFDRYHGVLFGYLCRRGIDKETAADIVQNAFVMIWDKRDRIDENKSLRAFLFRVGYTRALNHFRDTAKFDHYTDLDVSSAPNPIGAGHDYSAMNESLARAIAALPERRRTVFELCFMEALSYREAAEMMNISIKTVENQMAYALKSIRTAMAHFR